MGAASAVAARGYSYSAGGALPAGGARRGIVTVASAAPKGAKLIGFHGAPEANAKAMVESGTVDPDKTGEHHDGVSQAGRGTYLTTARPAAVFFARKGGKPGGRVFEVHRGNEEGDTEPATASVLAKLHGKESPELAALRAANHELHLGPSHIPPKWAKAYNDNGGDPTAGGQFNEPQAGDGKPTPAQTTLLTDLAHSDKKVTYTLVPTKVSGAEKVASYEANHNKGAIAALERIKQDRLDAIARREAKGPEPAAAPPEPAEEQ